MSDVQNDTETQQINELLYRRGLISWNIEQLQIELHEVNQALKQLATAKKHAAITATDK
jgi:hypothetical protein